MPDFPDSPDVAAFSLDVLAGHMTNATPLAADDDGNLIVAGRTRWRPVKFGPGLRTVVCARVDQPRARPPEDPPWPS